MIVIWSKDVVAKQGFLKYYLNGNVVGTKVGVRNRQGGHTSEVVVKRGSTVQSVNKSINSHLM